MAVRPADTGLVLPAYDPDEAKLHRYASRLEEHLAPAQIRIEIDDPDPSTLEALDDLDATVHAVDRRRGKGAAISDGFDALDTSILLFADADGATAPASVADVVAAVQEGADVAVGSRRHPEASVSNRPLHRHILSAGLAAVARPTLGISVQDTQCGVKALTRDAWERIGHRIEEDGFAWDLGLLARAEAAGLSVEEVPVRWHDERDSSVSLLPTTATFLQALVSIRQQIG